MHELDIAERISKAVANAAKENNFSKVNEVKLRVGVTQAAHPDQLKFFLNKQEEMLKETKVDIEEVNVVLKCVSCGEEFTDDRFLDHDFAHSFAHAPGLYISPKCPKCEAERSQMIKGQELEIISIDGE